MRNDIYQALYQHQFKDQNIAKFYLDRYVKFIDSRKNRILTEETYTEKHHIVPKSWSKGNEYDYLSKDKENLIKLTAREHYIVHRILYMTRDSSMCYAFRNFIDKRNYTLDGSEYKITNRLYESFRIKYSEIQSEISKLMWQNENHKNHIKNLMIKRFSSKSERIKQSEYSKNIGMIQITGN